MNCAVQPLAFVPQLIALPTKRLNLPFPTVLGTRYSVLGNAGQRNASRRCGAYS
jgi:hypothetical protein